MPTRGLSVYRSPETRKPGRDGWAKRKKRYEKSVAPQSGQNRELLAAEGAGELPGFRNQALRDKVKIGLT